MDIKILQHEHPEIKEIRSAWERIRVLVEEDEKHYTDEAYFVAFPNESDTEKSKRKIAYKMGFFNPTQELVNASGEYICRQDIVRSSPSSELTDFFLRADKSGQSMNDFVKNQISPNLTAYGTVFTVVDKPRTQFNTRADELSNGMPYLCVLNPLQVKDWQWGDDGELLWFRYVQGSNYDRLDPFSEPPSSDLEYITWTRDEFYRHNSDGNLIESFSHGFGLVPIAIQASFIIDTQKTIGKSTFFSGSRKIFMGNNLLSKANQEILKYGSVLLMSTMDADPRQRERDLDPETNLPRMSSPSSEGNILSTGDMANPPSYLEKDISIVDKANEQAQKYFTWAAKAEATGQQAQPLQDAQASPQSGVSKAYDFQDVDANLYAKAQDLQSLENQIMKIVSAELKVNADYSIQYPKSFDVDSFEAKVAQVADLKRIGFMSETGIKIANKRITSDITQDENEMDVINAEIDSYKEPEVPEDEKVDSSNVNL
jgi:hypothetical protein